MHFTEFDTETPLQHMSRALDELARGGFDLAAVRLVRDAAAAHVRIDFCGSGSVTPETYLARLDRIPGLSVTAAGPAGAAADAAGR